MSLDSHLIRDIHLFILDIHLLEWVSSLTANLTKDSHFYSRQSKKHPLRRQRTPQE